MSYTAEQILNLFEPATTAELVYDKGIVFVMHLSESGKWAVGEAAGTFAGKYPTRESLPKMIREGLKDGESLLVVLAGKDMSRTNRLALRKALLNRKAKDDDERSPIGY